MMKKKLMLICSLVHFTPMYSAQILAKKDQSSQSVQEIAKNDVQSIQSDQMPHKITNDQIFYYTVAGMGLIGLIAAMAVAMLAYTNTHSGNKSDK